MHHGAVLLTPQEAMVPYYAASKNMGGTNDHAARRWLREQGGYEAFVPRLEQCQNLMVALDTGVPFACLQHTVVVTWDGIHARSPNGSRARREICDSCLELAKIKQAAMREVRLGCVEMMRVKHSGRRAATEAAVAQDTARKVAEVFDWPEMQVVSTIHLLETSSSHFCYKWLADARAEASKQGVSLEDYLTGSDIGALDFEGVFSHEDAAHKVWEVGLTYMKDSKLHTLSILLNPLARGGDPSKTKADFLAWVNCTGGDSARHYA